MHSGDRSSESSDAIDSELRALVRAPAVDPKTFLERSASTRLQPGTVLGGTFVVEEELGHGGMGVVYLAHHEVLGRRVAVKLCLRRPTTEQTERLLHEARATAALSHPNIVVVHHVGEHDDQVYVVMEYVAGGTLRQWLSTERRSHASIVEKFLEAGRGLAAAHTAGLVHRDFKPDNVFIGRDGRARVGDFGLARLSPDADEPPSVESIGTAAGRSSTAIAGTPRYMPPEQHAGGQVTAAADQFALCVALFEALTGAHPFAGESSDAIGRAVIEGRRREGVGISGPARVRRAIEKGLAVLPRDRHASMDALVDALSPARRVAPVFVAAGALAAVGVASMLLAGSSSDAPCDGPRLSAPVWPEDGRVALLDKLGASQLAAGPQLAESLDHAVDAYLSEWAHAEELVCEAAKNEEPQYRARQACLRRGAVELESTLSLLTEGELHTTARSLELVGQLQPPQQCATASLANSGGAQVEMAPAVEASLSRARAALRGLALDDAWAHATEALDTATANRSRAEALVVRMEIAREQEDYPLAREQSELALQLAIELGADDLAGQVASNRVKIDGVGDSDLESALRWAGRARAWHARTGASMQERTALEMRVGLTHRGAHQFDEAEAALQRVLAELRSADSPPAGAYAAALLNLGVIYKSAGRYEEAETSVREAMALVDAEFGVDHPDHTACLHTLATILRNTGRAREAIPLAKQVLAQWQAQAGARSPRTAAAHSNLAAVLTDVGDRAGAAEHLGEALAIFEAKGNAEQQRKVSMNLAILATKQGDMVAALEHAERTVARAEQTNSPVAVAEALVVLGDMHMRAGEYEQAQTVGERAVVASELAFERSDPLWASGLMLAATAAQALEQTGPALSHYAAAREALSATKVGREHPNWIYAEVGYAKALVDVGRAAEALPILLRLSSTTAPAHQLRIQVDLYEALAHAHTGDHERAATALSRAEAIAEPAGDAAMTEAVKLVRAKLRDLRRSAK